MEQYLLCLKSLHRHKHYDFWEHRDYKLVKADSLVEAKRKYKEWFNRQKRGKIKVSNVICQNMD